jgi:hypothetical protein
MLEFRLEPLWGVSNLARLENILLHPGHADKQRHVVQLAIPCRAAENGSVELGGNSPE